VTVSSPGPAVALKFSKRSRFYVLWRGLLRGVGPTTDFSTTAFLNLDYLGGAVSCVLQVLALE
jgi:hypothetical protein